MPPRKDRSAQVFVGGNFVGMRGLKDLGTAEHGGPNQERLLANVHTP